MEYLFYDIEVFKHDALVIFKDIDKNVVKSYHNDFNGLGEFIKGKTLVGFNNYHYDDIILTAMISNWSNYQIKVLNDEIINGTCLKKANLNCITLDCHQEISVMRPSLKYIEGNMGKMIMESSVDFNIDRPLTTEEFQEVFKYCSYDIDTTIDIYKIRENSYFKVKNMLSKKLDINNAYKWNTTTISAQLLIDGKPLAKWSGLRGVDDFIDIVPENVKQMWIDGTRIIEDKDTAKSITVNEFNNDIVFAFGGLHGAPKGVGVYKDVKLLDVASMYPNIIININALGEYTSKYKEILDRRLAIKHKDKLESDALKLILNSVYGNLKNKYSKLYNPNASKSVCIYGQIALYDLCKRLYSVGCEIVNINTDGVAFKTHNNSEDYKTVYKQWELDYKFTLEEDQFDVLIQKDVNNYIGVSNNKIKCKGGYVNKYERDNLFNNNSCRIVDIAIVNKLVHGIDVLETLLENRDKPYLYQMILKAGNTYQGVYDKDDNAYQKVNRVFATRNNGICLYKKREDGGLVRFPDTPDNMFLWNDDCDKIEGFNKIIDLNFYYNLINTKLSDWGVV